MDRRTFVTGTAAALAAAALLGSSSEADAAPAANVHPELTGVWVDPYLRQPAAIVISSNASGSEVRVTGTYYHASHGQSTFHGTGTLQGDRLVVEYDHHGNPDLGPGKVEMRLGKAGGVSVLKGGGAKNDGSWKADMVWYRERH